MGVEVDRILLFTDNVVVMIESREELQKMLNVPRKYVCREVKV